MAQDNLPNEIRPDRIPEEKLAKKAADKKKLQFRVIIAAILCAMAAGFFLVLTSGSEPAPQGEPEPSASLSSFVSAPDGTAATPTVPSTIAGGTYPTLTLPQGTVPSGASTPSTTLGGAANTTSSAEDASVSMPATLPEANGTMHVSQDTDNRFIQIIHQAYNLPTARLTAVYSLPDTGQNYVLEWNGSTDSAGNMLRNADTLRRCFLIDETGQVTAVAATDADERENMSAIENTFAMETLIKRVILPQISAELDS